MNVGLVPEPSAMMSLRRRRLLLRMGIGAEAGVTVPFYCRTTAKVTHIIFVDSSNIIVLPFLVQTYRGVLYVETTAV